MAKTKNPYTPKTREEFEAYARAMDEANSMVIENVGKSKGISPKDPAKTGAKKSATKAPAKKGCKK